MAEEKEDPRRRFRKGPVILQMPEMVWYPVENSLSRSRDKANIQNSTLLGGECHDLVFDSLPGTSKSDKDDRRSCRKLGF